MRILTVFVVALLLVAATAAAAPIGDDYWLSFGPFVTAGAHLQPQADDAGETADAVLGGGLGLIHLGGFAYQAQLEGAYLPVLGGGTIRGELGAGYGYLLVGGSIAQYYGEDALTTVGPVVTASIPLHGGGPEPRRTTHAVSVFYRLDVPVSGPDPEYELRHQAGLRFLFDSPVLLEIFNTPRGSWWGL